MPKRTRKKERKQVRWFPAGRGRRDEPFAHIGEQGLSSQWNPTNPSQQVLARE